MSQSSTSEGTKIAQAAKDLNVTSVTIRRYLSEFNIETTTDDNGVKVLPDQAMEELKTVRKLKEDGLTNPKVMETLEENRVKDTSKKKPIKAKTRPAVRITPKAKVADDVEEVEVNTEIDLSASIEDSESKDTESPESEEAQTELNSEIDPSAPARSKHSLTCQTCGKVFEHMNPRLRDCLDCYRTKRKERRRGGAERHKNVIQHPLAQQVATKNTQQQAATGAISAPAITGTTGSGSITSSPVAQFAPTQRASTVRNYRKAIEDTRHITSSLKRRLERPDLSDGERRWLEQIYAYQLILHQGWRHLSDYKNAGQQQSQHSQNESPTV